MHRQEMHQVLVAASLILPFSLITILLAIFPAVVYFFPSNSGGIQWMDYADYYTKVTSVYTGLLGVVVGFYFGKSSDRSGEKNKTEQDREVL